MAEFTYFSLFIILFFCSFLKVNSYYFQNTHFLISAKLNGTSPVISLNNLNDKSNYINFLFDFDYHYHNIQESRNIAYFEIKTNIDNIDEALNYRFFKENWTKIMKKEVYKILNYNKIKILSKEENDSDKNKIYTYRFKIERNDNKFETLLIKVPTQNKKEGFISIENFLNSD